MSLKMKELKENETTNILIVGVGGQGALLISKIIGNAALAAGRKVTISEIHGMAQRGGAVETLVRIGEDESPITDNIHILVSLEPAEVLRNLHRISTETAVVTSSNTIVPFTVSVGLAEYPDIDAALENLNSKFGNLLAIDAENLATKAGNAIASNVVLLGCLTAVEGLPLDYELIRDTVKGMVPPKTIDVNMEALRLGREACLK